jgi:hypothetical protein
MIGALTAVALCLAMPPGSQTPPSPVRQARPTTTGGFLVVPFETAGRDGRTYWLGEAAAVLISDDIRARVRSTAPAGQLGPEPRDGDQGG